MEDEPVRHEVGMGFQDEGGSGTASQDSTQQARFCHLQQPSSHLQRPYSLRETLLLADALHAACRPCRMLETSKKPKCSCKAVVAPL